MHSTILYGLLLNSQDTCNVYEHCMYSGGGGGGGK